MQLKNININLYWVLLSLVMFASSCSSTKTNVTDVEYNVTLTNDEKALIREAKSWIGTKYVYGGQSRSGTDCSGFVMNVYLAVYDKKLPRTSKDQHAYCKIIDKKDLKVGDLVFFATGKSSSKVSHVGIYIGNDEFIHASSSKGVVIASLNQSYYVRTFVSAGRIVGLKK